MTTIADSLSILGKQPKLIYSTNFGGGMALGAVVILGATGAYTQGWQHITSNDTGTGYNFSALTDYFGPKTDFYIQRLPVPNLEDANTTLAATTLDTIMTCAIQNTTMQVDPGGKELAITLIKRNPLSSNHALSSNPQSPLLIERYRDDYPTNTIPIPHTDEIAWEYDCILDSNLTNLPADSNHYMVLSEMKTGDLRASLPNGAYTPNIGSFRFDILIQRNVDGLYFSSFTDNMSGAVGVYNTGDNSKAGFYFCPFTASSRQINVGDQVRGVTSGAIGTASWSELRVNTWGSSGKGILVITDATGAFTAAGESLQVLVDGAWTTACTATKCYSGFENSSLTNVENKYRINRTAGGTVPLNTQIRIQVRMKLPTSRTDLTNGVIQASMINLSTGARLTLCDFQGGIMCGALEDPLTRIFIINPYSSYNDTAYPGDPTIGLTHKITNFKLWEDFPFPIV